MVEIHTLKKITKKSSRRLGQGYGSARAKTSGRGTKGQKARTKIKLSFEGGALPLIKRLPMLRGKGRNKSIKKAQIVINISDLNALPAKTVVDAETLVKYNIISRIIMEKKLGIKILGDGSLDKSLTVKLPVSKGARQKIEASGGSVS